MKKAVMYGAGNIGRGFIGQLLRASDYRVVFIDIDKTVVDQINRDGRYPIRIAAREGYRDHYVDQVEAVMGTDVNLVSEHIKDADLMATAVGVNVLPKIAEPIARGIIKRLDSERLQPLNIIICENLLDAHIYLGKLLKEALPSEYHQRFEQNIGLVEASIGRMVPVMTDEMKAENPLLVVVEEYDKFPVDKDGFCKQIPKIHNMVPYRPFSFYIERKLYMHNMAHAVAAYIGKYENYEYIWQACEDAKIKVMVMKALQESALSMAKKHSVDCGSLFHHADDLLWRFLNPMLKDTVDRVGKDTQRKLSATDRLAGAAKLSEKMGFLPVYILLGLAAGFHFCAKDDPQSDETIRQVNQNGIASVIETLCDIPPTSAMHSIIVLLYDMIKKGVSLQKITTACEEHKNRWIRNLDSYI